MLPSPPPHKRWVHIVPHSLGGSGSGNLGLWVDIHTFYGNRSTPKSHYPIKVAYTAVLCRNLSVLPRPNQTAETSKKSIHVPIRCLPTHISTPEGPFNRSTCLHVPKLEYNNNFIQPHHRNEGPSSSSLFSAAQLIISPSLWPWLGEVCASVLCASKTCIYGLALYIMSPWFYRLLNQETTRTNTLQSGESLSVNVSHYALSLCVVFVVVGMSLGVTSVKPVWRSW